MNENSNKEMDKGAHRIAYLVAGYIRQTLTEKEHDELDEWIVASDENQKLFERLTDPEVIEKSLKEMEGVDTEAALMKIKERMRFGNEEEVKDEVKIKWERRRKIVRFSYAVAACLVFGVGLFGVYRMMQKSKSNGQLAIGNEQLMPGSDQATLTLEDGRVIDLGKQQNGSINISHGLMVEKVTDSQVVYEAGANSDLASVLHTLSTPVGGQYKVVLPDGTKVWLNASSSLKYPVAFNGDIREVELTGEGYFEVEPHPRPLSKGEGGTTPGQKATPASGGQGRVPFIVKANGIEVEVLGTHFNVNAYKDEEGQRVTLLEGRVKVGNGKWQVGSKEFGVGGLELKPGQQAIFEIFKNISALDGAVSGEWSVVNGVNTDEVVAWKNGIFKFKNQQIDVIMRQVARWYGAEIVYEGTKTDFHFNATINRNEPVSKLLALLEETGRVHFTVEGKKIVARP